MLHRKKPARSPSVVAISLTAVALASVASVACGGKVADGGAESTFGSHGNKGSGGSGGSSGVSGSPDVSSNPSGPVGCSDATKAGDPCPADSDMWCGNAAAGPTLVCWDGRWIPPEDRYPEPPMPQEPPAVDAGGGD